MKTAIVVGLVLAGWCAAQEYTKDGELVLPKDYRGWVFLSSGIGMTYSNAAAAAPPVFDNVFVNPAAYAGFLKTGVWPDKTVLLTENRASGSHASNANGRFQTDLLGFEAHVKDSRRGGWSFYRIEKGAASGKAFPKTASCFSCHEKNGAADTTFVQFYPTLIEAARRMGTFRDGGDVAP